MDIGSHDKFLDLKPGSRVRHEGREYILAELIGQSVILGQDAETNKWEHLAISKLESVLQGDEDPPSAPDVVVRTKEYEVAKKRMAAVNEFLASTLRSEEAAKAIGKKYGVGKSTLYAWVRRYLDAPQLATLIPTKPGPDGGGHKLDPKIEAIVELALLETVRIPQRKRSARAIIAVKKMCKAAGLVSPHGNTVRARIDALPRAKTLRERGRQDEAEQFDPILGFVSSSQLLKIVEMDHALADTELVDDVMRLPLGRPWITLLIDVCSRAVIGVALSMQRPNAFMAGSAVANAILPKHEYLKRLDVNGEWNAWGQIRTLQMDNAKEFRGQVIETSCEAYGINPYFRPVKTPHYGGHIERLMGTVAEELRNLPGATFSNPRERKGYDSGKEAVFTFLEFERLLTHWIVNIYNKKPHSSLWGMTPEGKWNEKAAETEVELNGLIQRPPKDPERVRIDFMPFEYRTIGRKGILFDHIHYWDDIFKTRIHETEPESRKRMRKFLIRYDPRNINAIWFYDPDSDRYKRVATWHRGRPAVSLWEWRAVKVYMIEKGAESYDEDKMFEALDVLRNMSKESGAKTKTARRQQHLKTRAKEVGDEYAKRDADNSQPPEAPEPDTVPNKTKPRPFKPIEGVEF
jgi:putative transposase